MSPSLHGSSSITAHVNPLWTETQQHNTNLEDSECTHMQEPLLDSVHHHSMNSCQNQLQDPELVSDSKQLHSNLLHHHVTQLSLLQLDLPATMHDSVKQHQRSCENVQQSVHSPMSGSPQSARSSQSDATHIDHQDSYMSGEQWQDGQQQSAGGLNACTDMGVSTASSPQASGGGAMTAGRAERRTHDQVSAHGATGSCSLTLQDSLSGYHVPANPLAFASEDEQSPRYADLSDGHNS